MGSSQSKDRSVHIVRRGPDAPLPPEYLEGASKSSSASSSDYFSSNNNSNHPNDDTGFQPPRYPISTGHETDAIDQIAEKLPQYMDEVTRQRVIQAAEQCQGGRGNMIPCFNHAEFLTQFQSRHAEAAEFFVNACFRPKDDKSPHGVLIDDSKCFPAACFQLASMRMTGKGGTKCDRTEAYHLYDRACRGGHGGACHFQARMMLSYPGQLGPDIPYNPPRAAELLDVVCHKHNDPVSCFTLASLYLRGDRVSSEATYVTPQEARGLKEIDTPTTTTSGSAGDFPTAAAAAEPKEKVSQLTNATPSSLQFNPSSSSSASARSRAKHAKDERKPLQRNPRKALDVLLHACNELNHGGACHNVAVMYTQGDDGVPADPVKAQYYKEKTEKLLNSGAGILPF